MSHLLENIYLVSKREDIINYFMSMKEVFCNLLIENNVPSPGELRKSLVVLDASILDSSPRSLFVQIEEKTYPILCIVPFQISNNIKQYVEGKFNYTIPFPIQKNLAINYCKNILEEIRVKNHEINETRKQFCQKFTEKTSFFGFFYGKSKLIKEVRTKIEKIAQNDSTVLLLGETGTGKSTCGNIIHKLSKRGNKKIITCNISTVVDTLASSTFFGTETGAYTDATAKEGLFKQAHKSSLFLDEIGLASLSVQGILLDVINTGKVQKVGSDNFEKVDVRLITATNENLEQLINENKFRRDFFYRIQDNILKLPALRERPEDIPSIVDNYLINKQKTLSNSAIEKLQEYRWNGNIRELIQCLNRAIDYSTEDIITADEIEFSIFDA